MSRLRSYAPMKRQSPKLLAAHRAATKGRERLSPGQVVFSSAFEAVALRADGRCEVVLDGVRCRRRPVDQHHTRKPRRSFDTAEYRIAVCRTCHERCDFPFSRGRLQIATNGDGTFRCAIVTAPDKFTYRQQGPR